MHAQSMFAHQAGPGDPCVLFTPRGNWYAAAGDQPLGRDTVGTYIESMPSIRIEHNENGYPMFKPEYLSGRSAAVSGDTLFVLHGGAGPLAKRVVDVYLVSSRRYLRSFELKSIGSHITYANGVFAISEYTDDFSRVAWYRVPAP